MDKKPAAPIVCLIDWEIFHSLQHYLAIRLEIARQPGEKNRQTSPTCNHTQNMSLTGATKRIEQYFIDQQ